jgi:hypothetical protein
VEVSFRFVLASWSCCVVGFLVAEMTLTTSVNANFRRFGNIKYDTTTNMDPMNEIADPATYEKQSGSMFV